MKNLKFLFFLEKSLHFSLFWWNKSDTILVRLYILLFVQFGKRTYKIPVSTAFALESSIPTFKSWLKLKKNELLLFATPLVLIPNFLKILLNVPKLV